MPPPSIVGGKPSVPTSPPQVRVPTSGPSFRWRNMYGNASPPEPADSLMIITLGPQIPAVGEVAGLAVALRKETHQFSVQFADDVIGHLSALVVTLIYNRAFFVLLRIVVASESRVTRAGRVGKPDVGQAATGKLVNQAAIVFDPCSRAEGIFAWRRESQSPRVNLPSRESC